MSNQVELLIPHACPVPLIRVGGDHDGAYLIPDDLQGVVACFSPGVNVTKDFEDDLANRFGIKSFLCDYSADPLCLKTPLIPGLQTFEKKRLEPASSEISTSLEDWVNRVLPHPIGDLLLQIDIEGAEYRNLLPASDSVLRRFRIIVIELHQVDVMVNGPADNQVARLLMKLNETHKCVHAHPNNCCGDVIDPPTGMNIPRVLGLTYLRHDRFPIQEKPLLLPQLPHPEDIKYNVRDTPPLHLNDRWLHSKQRSTASTIKALQDNLDFANQSSASLREKINAKHEHLTRLASFSRRAISNLYNTLGYDALTISSQVASGGYIDVAMNQKVFCSSTKSTQIRTGDGPSLAKASLQTDIGFNQHLTVQHNCKLPLHSLAITRGRILPGTSYTNLYWIVHDDVNIDVSAALPILVTDTFLFTPNGRCWTPLLQLSGRFLTIFSPDYGSLELNELSIFALPDAT